MPQKQLPIKRKFEFGEEDLNALFDVYVQGTKVLNGHNVIKGHVYLHLPEDFDESEVDFQPHDPRKPIEGVLTAEGMEPYIDEAAIQREIEEEEKRKVLAKKKEAAEKAKAEIAKRQKEFAEKKKTQQMQSGGVIPKPEAPE